MENKDLLGIKKELETQDNRSTANPLFVVYEWEKIWSDQEGENTVWLDCDYGEWEEKDLVKELREVHEEKFEWEEDGIFNDEFKEAAEKHEYHQHSFIERRRFISAFFTEKSAQSFIDCNHYHWRKPHIYVETLWRNDEMQDIREALLNGWFAVSEVSD